LQLRLRKSFDIRLERQIADHHRLPRAAQRGRLLRATLPLDRRGRLAAA
jgi:hypothetical protein